MSCRWGLGRARMCGTVWDKMLSKPEFSNLDIKEYFSNVSSMFCTCSYGQAGRALSSCLSIKRLPETVWQPHSSTRSSTGDPPAAWGCPSPSHGDISTGSGAERRSVTWISSSQPLPSCLCIGERNSLMAGLAQSPPWSAGTGDAAWVQRSCGLSLGCSWVGRKLTSPRSA